MNVPALILLCATVVSADPAASDPGDAFRALEQTYQQHTAEYKLFRDKQHSQQLTLSESPVYKWIDAQEKGHTGGMVFVWTWQGRPEAIGAIFSNPVGAQQRRITHEFHSLSPEVLRAAEGGWSPASGIETKEVSNAPAVAAARPSRLAQMRTLARRYSCYTIDHEGQRWEQRLLPQPLFRSAPIDGDPMSDFALFAFVTSELTDPEVILLLETVPTNGGYEWRYSLARFSGYRTYVQYNNREVWTSFPKTADHNENHTYQLIQQPLVAETLR